MNQFSYRPGTWQVVVGNGGVVAVPGDVATDRVVRLTRMLQQGTPALTDVIDVLAAGSIATLGSFAVALTPGGSVRFAVRGPVTVRIDGASGAETVSGADVSTWSERYVVDPKGFELELEQPAGDAVLPIRSGVVLAASLRTGTDAPAASADAASDAEASPAPAPAVPPSAVEPDAGPALHTLIPGEFTFGSESEAMQEADAADAAPDGEDATGEEASGEGASGGETPTEETPVAGDHGDDAAPASDFALEQTIHKAPSAPPAPPPPAPPAPVPFPSTAPPMPPAPPAPAGLGDHDGATISLAEVRRLRAEAGGGPVDPEAPTEMIPTADAPPASHGVARLSTGQVVELDRTVIIGRRPRSTRASGESMPHLVAVDSPQQDISRSHLEIRPEGDSVVVIDLRTTNGSTLIRPGADPVRLHPGEQTLVLDGDVVDLGDGVTVTFEGLT